MTRPAHRPETFTVLYHDKPVVFTYLDAGEQSRGYMFYCPKHNPRGDRAFNWIDTESGTRHTLTFDEAGRATIRASILCRTPIKGTQGTPIATIEGRVECGWHVFVTDGVARDA